MTLAEQREAARQFYNKWHGKGREDEDARSYWIDILQNIFGMDHVTDRVDCIRRNPVAAFAAMSGHGAERVAGTLEV